jgi:hypothetical protein
LEQLASEGYPVRPEDVALLSPLVFDHINLLGRYAFSFPDSIARGQLRPLRIRPMLWKMSPEGTWGMWNDCSGFLMHDNQHYPT